MSTATFQEPLRAVPPPDQMKERFNALLAAKDAARRAFDAIMAAPRQAAGFVGRLVHALHLRAPVRWLSGGLAWAREYAGWAGRRLGRTGLVSGVASVVTSKPGQAVIRRVGGLLSRGVGWLGRTAYKAVDSGLRLFGRPGNRAADALFGFAVRAGGWMAAAASPVVHRVARFTDPEAVHVRVLAGIARSYVVHRMGRSVVSNRWLRLLLDSTLIPTLVDSRIGRWLRVLVHQVATRLGHLRDQRRAMTAIQEAPDCTVAIEPVAVPSEAPTPLDMPQPANRAERRAMQRQHAQLRLRPSQ